MISFENSRGDKVRPNSFAYLNLSILTELKPIQLLVGLNEYQPN